MEETELSRIRLLIGEAALQRLQNSCVLVAGVGGVGSYAAEALARSGVGHLILVDADTVALSNLNRQIMADHSTVGMAKCEAMQQRIAAYNSACRVDGRQIFLTAENIAVVQEADFVIDAIDTVASKLDLVEACHRYHIPMVSSLGMGNRLDPSQVCYTTLQKTSGDPLARSVRSMARRRGIDYPVPVLFSAEQPRVQNQTVNPDGTTRKQRIPPASMIFVPAAAGLLAASVAVRTLTGERI